MPSAKYDKIYRELRRRIETEEYEFQEMLPSEKVLTEQFESSRNTVRRAISQLAAEAYVQSVHGKGVVVIYQKENQAELKPCAKQQSVTIWNIQRR